MNAKKIGVIRTATAPTRQEALSVSAKLAILETDLLVLVNYSVFSTNLHMYRSVPPLMLRFRC